MHILVLHGINLNMLGRRDPTFYGRETLAGIERQMRQLGQELGIDVEHFQTNHEGELVERIHRVMDTPRDAPVDAVIINAGAWTHTSLALADALEMLCVPVVEVHLSNIYARKETIRHTSLLARVCAGSICGFGAQSYLLALRAAHALVMAKKGKDMTASTRLV